MTDILNASRADELLRALAEQLAAAGESYELAVIGGSALLALGLIDRPTRDVDVVALREAGVLTKAKPLPPGLVAAGLGWHVISGSRQTGSTLSPRT